MAATLEAAAHQERAVALIECEAILGSHVLAAINRGDRSADCALVAARAEIQALSRANRQPAPPEAPR